MSEREILIKILNNAPKSGIEKIADYFLKNGVVIFPVKNRDIVWFYDKFELKHGEVSCIEYCKAKIDNLVNFDNFFSFEVAYWEEKYGPLIFLKFSNRDIGLSVFLTEQEAKNAKEIDKYYNIVH